MALTNATKKSEQSWKTENDSVGEGGDCRWSGRGGCSV